MQTKAPKVKLPFTLRAVSLTDRLPAGISLITQTLYAAVFLTRYLDLFNTFKQGRSWNFVLKIFYILSSLYIIALMMRVYARTREREKAWRLGALCLGGAIVAAPFVTIIFKKWKGASFNEVSLEASIDVFGLKRDKDIVDILHYS